MANDKWRSEMLIEVRLNVPPAIIQCRSLAEDDKDDGNKSMVRLLSCLHNATWRGRREPVKSKWIVFTLYGAAFVVTQSFYLPPYVFNLINFMRFEWSRKLSNNVPFHVLLEFANAPDNDVTFNLTQMNRYSGQRSFTTTTSRLCMNMVCGRNTSPSSSFATLLPA